MKVDLYVIPVGRMGDQVISTIEAYVADLAMIVSNLGSQLVEPQHLEQRYGEMEPIDSFEISPEDEPLYRDLHDSLSQTTEKEIKVFERLAPVLQAKAKEIQEKPRILVPNPVESKLILES